MAAPASGCQSRHRCEGRPQGAHSAAEPRNSDSLDGLETVDDYVQLTGAMMTYVVRMHRWIHFILPWNLGVAFPHRQPAEIDAIAAIAGGAPHPIPAG